MSEVIATNQSILVVGGGISGMTAALEAAEYAKLCHPKCGLEINLRRIKANRNLRVMAMTEVTNIDGEAGNYSVTLKTSPRYVNENCTNCGACGDAVEAEFDDEYNYGLSKRKAAYRPFNQAYPERFVLDSRIIGTADADTAKAACKYDAIDLDMQEEETTITVGAVIWATGWKPYDAAKIQPYGRAHARPARSDRRQNPAPE
jgi:quinone-modifying oxidoreductase subunit QmoA